MSQSIDHIPVPDERLIVFVRCEFCGWPGIGTTRKDPEDGHYKWSCWLCSTAAYVAGGTVHVMNKKSAPGWRPAKRRKR